MHMKFSEVFGFFEVMMIWEKDGRRRIISGMSRLLPWKYPKFELFCV